MTVYPESYVFPEHIQIETIRGVCTARCIMCPINSWQRSGTIMSLQKFEILLQKLQGNTRQRFLTLHGLGEPLLDKELPEKIKIAKKYQYKGVGFASNCTDLTGDLAKKLLDSGLDTIICSIDGFTKSVHESIRIGTNFDKIVENVKRFLSIRNTFNYQTKVLVRFIGQKSNDHEWNDYCAYWNQHIDKSYGDDILRFDVHNWGGEDEKTAFSSMKHKKYDEIDVSGATCGYLEGSLSIQASGRLSFCCVDDNDYFELGNAFSEDPYVLWNNEPFAAYREAMRRGKLRSLAPCSTCSVIIGRQTRILPDQLMSNLSCQKYP